MTRGIRLREQQNFHNKPIKESRERKRERERERERERDEGQESREREMKRRLAYNICH